MDDECEDTLRKHQYTKLHSLIWSTNRDCNGGLENEEVQWRVYLQKSTHTEIALCGVNGLLSKTWTGNIPGYGVNTF